MSCPECDRQISDKAYSCPHCGFPIQKVECEAQREERINNYNSLVDPKSTLYNAFCPVCGEVGYARAHEGCHFCGTEMVLTNYEDNPKTDLARDAAIKAEIDARIKELGQLDGSLHQVQLEWSKTWIRPGSGALSCPVHGGGYAPNLMYCSTCGRDLIKLDDYQKAKWAREDAKKIPKCPSCGSTHVQMVPRKWSLLTGFMTNKVDRVCIACKHKW